MTDHDRGAYTPQPDAPLQFDARSPRARRPMPMTLIGSGAVLLVLLGALALHYRHDKTEPPRPVGEPIAQVKAAAPVDAQPRDPAAGVDVFGGSAKNTAKTPTFAPPPEAPKPRDRLTVQAVDGVVGKAPPVLSTTAPTGTTTGTAPIAPKSASTALAGAAPAYKAPTPTALTKPDATAVIASVAATPAKATPPVVVAKPAVSSTAAVKPAPVAKPAAVAKATAPGGPAVVQIGAFSSTALSDKGWSDVMAAMGADMAGKSKRVEALEKDGKTLYRTSVTGFLSRTAADAFCKSLAAKGKICFVKS